MTPNTFIVGYLSEPPKKNIFNQRMIKKDEEKKKKDFKKKKKFNFLTYPRIPYCPARFWSTVASTAATFTPVFLRAFAAFSHSGARFLQCPHQGAKNSTIQISSLFSTEAKLDPVNRVTSELAEYSVNEGTTSKSKSKSNRERGRERESGKPAIFVFFQLLIELSVECIELCDTVRESCFLKHKEEKKRFFFLFSFLFWFLFFFGFFFLTLNFYSSKLGNLFLSLLLQDLGCGKFGSKCVHWRQSIQNGSFFHLDCFAQISS